MMTLPILKQKNDNTEEQKRLEEIETESVVEDNTHKEKSALINKDLSDLKPSELEEVVKEGVFEDPTQKEASALINEDSSDPKPPVLEKIGTGSMPENPTQTKDSALINEGSPDPKPPELEEIGTEREPEDPTQMEDSDLINEDSSCAKLPGFEVIGTESVPEYPTQMENSSLSHEDLSDLKPSGLKNVGTECVPEDTTHKEDSALINQDLFCAKTLGLEEIGTESVYKDSSQMKDSDLINVGLSDPKPPGLEEIRTERVSEDPTLKEDSALINEDSSCAKLPEPEEIGTESVSEDPTQMEDSDLINEDSTCAKLPGLEVIGTESVPEYPTQMENSSLSNEDLSDLKPSGLIKDVVKEGVLEDPSQEGDSALINEDSSCPKPPGLEEIGAESVPEDHTHKEDSALITKDSSCAKPPGLEKVGTDCVYEVPTHMEDSALINEDSSCAKQPGLEEIWTESVSEDPTHKEDSALINEDLFCAKPPGLEEIGTERVSEDPTHKEDSALINKDLFCAKPPGLEEIGTERVSEDPTLKEDIALINEGSSDLKPSVLDKAVKKGILEDPTQKKNSALSKEGLSDTQPQGLEEVGVENVYEELAEKENIGLINEGSSDPEPTGLEEVGTKSEAENPTQNEGSVLINEGSFDSKPPELEEIGTGSVPKDQTQKKDSALINKGSSDPKPPGLEKIGTEREPEDPTQIEESDLINEDSSCAKLPGLEKIETECVPEDSTQMKDSDLINVSLNAHKPPGIEEIGTERELEDPTFKEVSALINEESSCAKPPEPEEIGTESLPEDPTQIEDSDLINEGLSDPAPHYVRVSEQKSPSTCEGSFKPRHDYQEKPNSNFEKDTKIEGKDEDNYSDSVEDNETEALNKQRITEKNGSLEVCEKYTLIKVFLKKKITQSAIFLMICLACFTRTSDPIVHHLPKEFFSNISHHEVSLKVGTVGFRGPTFIQPNNSFGEPSDLPTPNLVTNDNEHRNRMRNVSENLTRRSAENTYDANTVNISEMVSIVSSEEPLSSNLNDSNMLPLTDINYQDNGNNYHSLRHLEITTREERNQTIVPLQSLQSLSQNYPFTGTSFRANERILEGEIQSAICLDRPESTAAPTNVVVSETQDIPGNDVDSDVHGYLFNSTMFEPMNIPSGFSDTRTRAQTFNHPLWQHEFLDPQTMAENGFFYTGKKNHTMCYLCGIVLFDWKQGDDPSKEHMDKVPECYFARFKQAYGESRVEDHDLGVNEASGYSSDIRTENQRHLLSALHLNASRNDEICRYARNIHHPGLQSIQREQQNLHLHRDYLSSGNECYEGVGPAEMMFSAPANQESSGIQQTTNSQADYHQMHSPLFVSNQRRDLQRQHRERSQTLRGRRGVSSIRDISGSHRVPDNDETQRLYVWQDSSREDEVQLEAAQGNFLNHEPHEPRGLREISQPRENQGSVGIQESRDQWQPFLRRPRASFRQRCSVPSNISLAAHRRSSLSRMVQQIASQNRPDDERRERSDAADEHVSREAQNEASTADCHILQTQRSRDGNIERILNSDIGITVLRRGYSRSDVAGAIQRAGNEGEVTLQSVLAALFVLNVRRRRSRKGRSCQRSRPD